MQTWVIQILNIKYPEEEKMMFRYSKDFLLYHKNFFVHREVENKNGEKVRVILSTLIKCLMAIVSQANCVEWKTLN